MPAPSSFSFSVPTTFDDGVTPLPSGVPVSYSILVDTVNPPSTAYPVPAANVSAAVGGVVTVEFAALGFKPVIGTTYFADATAEEGQFVSLPSNLYSFTYTRPTASPTNLKAI